MPTQPKPLIVQSGAGEDLHAFGNVLTVILSGEQTSGTISVMSECTPPGGGPPLHVHSREDEIFLVVEGRLSYYADGQWTEVGVGGAVYLPKGCAHSYRNMGTAPSRHWIITAPSGFEKFFTSCAQEFSKTGGPSQERIVEIHQDYGIDLLDEEFGR